MQLEKQTRLASDAFATGKVAVEIVKILFECKVPVFFCWFQVCRALSKKAHFGALKSEDLLGFILSRFSVFSSHYKGLGVVQTKRRRQTLSPQGCDSDQSLC